MHDHDNMCSVPWSQVLILSPTHVVLLQCCGSGVGYYMDTQYTMSGIIIETVGTDPGQT